MNFDSEFKKSPHLWEFPSATLNLNFQFLERAERQVLLLGGSYQPKCWSFVDDWKATKEITKMKKVHIHSKD